jgi:type IV secretory pathway VirJ component
MNTIKVLRSGLSELINPFFSKSRERINYIKAALLFAFFSFLFLNSEQLQARVSGNCLLVKAIGTPDLKLKKDILAQLTLLPVMEDNDLPLVFFISGDGGWIKTDVEVSKLLNQHGMPVIGLNALKYFWKEKIPEESTIAFSEIIEQYLKLWHRNSFILVGYSFGAGVVPFITTRLQDPIKSLLRGIYCFSPEEKGNFKIRLSDFLYRKFGGKYNVLQELKKITLVKPVCAFGKEENTSIRKNFLSSGLRVVILPGNHHYDEKYIRVANVIIGDFTGPN